MKKILKTIFALGMVVGTFIILGAAGQSDYCVEMGEYLPVSVTVKQILLGLAMSAPGYYTSITHNWYRLYDCKKHR